MREKLHADIALLTSAEQTEKIRDSIERLNRCLKEIDDICGPDMTIPLS